MPISERHSKSFSILHNFYAQWLVHQKTSKLQLSPFVNHDFLQYLFSQENLSLLRRASSSKSLMVLFIDVNQSDDEFLRTPSISLSPSLVHNLALAVESSISGPVSESLTPYCSHDSSLIFSNPTFYESSSLSYGIFK